MTGLLLKRAVLIALPFFISAEAVAQDPIHEQPPAHSMTPAALNDTAMATVNGREAARLVPVGGQMLGGFIGTPWTIVSGIALTSGGKPSIKMAIGPAVSFGTLASIRGADHPLPRELRDIAMNHDSAYVASFRRAYNTTLNNRRGNAFALGSLAGVGAALGLFFLVVGPALAD